MISKDAFIDYVVAHAHSREDLEILYDEMLEEMEIELILEEDEDDGEMDIFEWEYITDEDDIQI